jgi:hypothetical protein
MIRCHVVHVQVCAATTDHRSSTTLTTCRSLTSAAKWLWHHLEVFIHIKGKGLSCTCRATDRGISHRPEGLKKVAVHRGKIPLSWQRSSLWVPDMSPGWVGDPTSAPSYGRNVSLSPSRNIAVWGCMTSSFHTWFPMEYVHLPTFPCSIPMPDILLVMPLPIEKVSVHLSSCTTVLCHQHAPKYTECHSNPPPPHFHTIAFILQSNCMLYPAC